MARHLPRILDRGKMRVQRLITQEACSLRPSSRQRVTDQTAQLVTPRLRDQVHGQVQVLRPPHRQGCLQRPPVHSPGQVAARVPHDQKWISLTQPRKLQDHRAVIQQYHLLTTLCFHQMQTLQLAGK